MAKIEKKVIREILLGDRLVKVEVHRSEKKGAYWHHYFTNPKSRKEEMFMEPLDSEPAEVTEE